MRVMILGAAGNFGTKITRMLADDANITLILCGRNREKLEAGIAAGTFRHEPETGIFDIEDGIRPVLEQFCPDLVIHTSGPFQHAGYDVAQACLQAGCHYIDLADARAFVTGFSSLDDLAKEKGLFLSSGASSVPGLSSAIIDHVAPHFAQISKLDYAISTAQQAKGGIATTRAVLGYAGKAFTAMDQGQKKQQFGWCDLGSMDFWRLGKKWLGRADIPDLDLFPDRYPGLTDHRFRAGTEIGFLQWVLWLQANLARMFRLPGLAWAAGAMMAVADIFDPFGSKRSGFYMIIDGLDHDGGHKRVRFDLLAENGDGLHIPVIPAVLLARRLAAGDRLPAGAGPCMGLVSLKEYLQALSVFQTSWQMSGAELSD